MSNQHCNSDDCHSGVCVRTVLHGDLVTVLRFPDSSTHRSQFQLPPGSYRNPHPLSLYVSEDSKILCRPVLIVRRVGVM